MVMVFGVPVTWFHKITNCDVNANKSSLTFKILFTLYNKSLKNLKMKCVSKSYNIILP